MSFTNTTAHYGLPQYIGTDKPTMLGDFNMAMETIDTQMYKNSQQVGDNSDNVTELGTQIVTLSQSVSTANQNVTNLEQQANTLESQLNTTTQNANSALTSAQNAQQSATTANTTANSAQTTASQAQTQGNSNASSIADLENRVAILEGNSPIGNNVVYFYPYNQAITYTGVATEINLTLDDLSNLGFDTTDLSTIKGGEVLNDVDMQVGVTSSGSHHTYQTELTIQSPTLAIFKIVAVSGSSPLTLTLDVAGFIFYQMK